MNVAVKPFALKDAPSLIEKLLPVQKLSAEAYKEQMAHIGKTLTSLGSYWKGRKPLILNKACVLGCLLPATNDLRRDLQVFERLMAMDDESFVLRHTRRPGPVEILAKVNIARITDYFDVTPSGVLPDSAPVDFSNEAYRKVKVVWRESVSEMGRRQLEAQLLPNVSYRERVECVRRPEEVGGALYNHVWDSVNSHLGTEAHSFPELVEQLGIMRFGHRPEVADPFCGSGQIPFEAARLGCNVYASDLNPMACMLTWGALHLCGGAPATGRVILDAQQRLVTQVRTELDQLGVETDGKGWRAKVFLYCVEARCPQTGWLVPLLPTLVISEGYRAVAELVPDSTNKRYDILIHSGVTDKQLESAQKGTIRSDGVSQDAYLVHTVNSVEYRTKLSTLRGDYRLPDGSTANKLRWWKKSDFRPCSDDLFQERLYAIEWMRPKEKRKSFEFEFRTVTQADLDREKQVEDFVAKNLSEWQAKGWVPDMRIEPGTKTDEPIRTRGWTYWHHLFNPRQLLLAGLVNKHADRAELKFGFTQMINVNARLSRWNNTRGGGGIVKGVFDNQALNPLFNYGCRGFDYAAPFLLQEYKNFPFHPEVRIHVDSVPASEIAKASDIYITDPPYGDAVKYEEILEFFIAWLRKNSPAQFANWVWDSRRALAIKGEGEDFRRGMVAAYQRMAQLMPDNGIQVIMFTHQSGSIWADMANIVWAAGLQVTVAWYVVTETNNALREGNYVKGTVLLVLRKRKNNHKVTRDDLAWEIQEEVENQVRELTGLNQEAKGLYRDENLFEDADLQMAGYAAALRVLTRYSTIDGRNMVVEAIRPRVKGTIGFVDDLIGFAVGVANRCLVPQGLENAQWARLTAVERFYLKLIDLEAKGLKALDNYQNFAKALKVRDFRPFMASHRANAARLKGAVEFGKSEMSEGSELHNTVLRGVLYAIMELARDMDGGQVLTHLSFNVPNYYDATQRTLVVGLADYLAKRLEGIRPDEASAARVLRELVRNQRL